MTAFRKFALRKTVAGFFRDATISERISLRKMRGTFYLVFATLPFIFSCASSPSPAPKSEEKLPAVAVQVSPSKNRSFFSSIDKETMRLVEIGSPQSLRQAAASIHKSSPDDYSDAEKSILYISAEIMKLAWPSEAVTWSVPPIARTNQYICAVESAKKGIYDLSMNRSDFLSIMLPSLVLLTSSGVTIEDYYELSENSLNFALELCPDSVLANYLMGILCLKQNENEKALEYFKLSNGKYAGGTKEILESVAKACFLTGKYELALSFGEELLSRFPQDTELLKTCALSAFHLGDFDKTEGFVVRVLLLEPDNTSYVLLRAKILMENQDYIRASSLLDAVEKKNSASKEYYLLRTQLLRDWSKNNAAAIETAGTALNLYPYDSETLLVAAETASVAGLSVNGMTALELAEKVLEKDSENVQAMEILLDEYIKKSDYAKAYSLSSRLMQIPSVQKTSLFRHIDICLALKKNTEAMNLALKDYEKNPADENSCMAYVKVLSASGQKNSAMQLISSLLSSASQKMKSFLYFERSQIQGTEDSVLADLRASLTANPRNKDSLYSLYKIYYAKKDWRRAQYYLKQVVALDPSNSLYLSKNSELEKLLGR